MCVRRNPTELQQPGRLEELELPRVATHSS
jgi:hypothetical protein